MANSVTVTVNVRDGSRAGIRRIRNQIRSLRDDITRAGGDARFNLVVPPGSRAQVLRTVRRIRRQIGDDPPATIRTTVVPPDRNRVRNTLVRALTAPFRGAGGTLGGILSDGIGQGIINGFRSGGPIFAAVFLTVLAGALSAIGAALAGILVGIIGSAFVGLGVFLAFQADEVKDKWAKTLADLKPLFEDAATPLLPVIEHARLELVRLGKAFAPHFKQALAGSAPHVQTLFDHIVRGFERLGAVASQPLQDAFNTLIAALGPMLEDTLADIGESLAQLANTIRDHSTEIAIAVNMVFQLIVALIEIINFLAEAWSFMLRTAAQGFGLLLGGIARVLDAMSKIPGMGFLEGAASDVRRLAKEYGDLGKRLDHANRKRRLEVDIQSFKARLAQARADLQRTSDKKAKAKLQADISDLNNKIAMAQRALNRLNGRVAYARVVTTYEARRVGSHGTELGNAHGGIIGAATGGVRSNMTLVGERGPELVNLPAGSRITSNEKSRQLVGSGSGGGSSMMNINLSLGGVGLGTVLVDLVRGEVLSQGGDVQATLGERTRAR